MGDALGNDAAPEAAVVSSDATGGLVPPIMEARVLERVYGRGGIATTALAGLTLEVQAGEFVAVMGRSGSGKSTLLRCLGGIDVPTSGSVYLRGRSLSEYSTSELARLRREVMTFIPQDSDLIETLDVLHNIMLPLAISGRHGDAVMRVAKEQATALGIAPILGSYPIQLSQGQRQLVSIARSLARVPQVLLADEPTGALDLRSASTALAALRRLNQTSGTTVVMVTHDASAASWADRVVFLLDGRIFAEARRGTDARKRFYARIISTVEMMGTTDDR